MAYCAKSRSVLSGRPGLWARLNSYLLILLFPLLSCLLPKAQTSAGANQIEQDGGVIVAQRRSDARTLEPGKPFERTMKTLIRVLLTFVFWQCILAGWAYAQTVDLSTDEAVVEQFGKLRNDKFSKDDVCIMRSARVIAIGLLACSFHAAFVNSVYVHAGADLSKNALNALGWKEANQKGREELAKLWVEKGLLAFSPVLYTKDKDLSNDKFHPPQVVSRKNGEVVVTLWMSFERRKLGRKVSGLTKGFARQEYTFAKDGNSSERVTHETLVP